MNNEKSWGETLEALKTTHTLDIKQICQMLKVSRVYFSKNIRPSLKDTIFLNTGKYGNKHKTNWTYMASIILKKPIISSLWFNSEEFYNFAYESIISTTRQTRLIPFIWLLKKECMEKYLELYNNLQEAKDSESFEAISTAVDILKQFKNNKENYTIAGATIMKNLPNEVKRSAAPAIKVNLKDLCSTPAQLPAFFNKAIAPCDIKDYGDSDEAVYRRLFNSGSIRIEFNFNAGKKVLYLQDFQNYEAPAGEQILIQEIDFQKFNSYFNALVYNNIP